MARRTFFSFHYKPDNWRASQVRQMGALEGNSPVSDNDWEAVTKGGNDAIEKWIQGQLSGRSCTIVLIGESTAGRKWINYEISESWKAGKGVLGVHIHNLLDSNQKQAAKGKNPFASLKLGDKDFSTIVRTYDPPYSGSTNVYNHIKDNIASWVETAIEIRGKY